MQTARLRRPRPLLPRKSRKKLSLSQQKDTDEDDQQLTDDDMKLLMDKLDDDEFIQQVVTRLVDKLSDKLVDSGLLEEHPSYEDDEDDISDIHELAARLADQAYGRTEDDADEEDDDADQEQNDAEQQTEDDAAQADEDQDDADEQQNNAEEQAEDDMSLAEQPDDANPWFALCDPGTLAASALLGAASACVVFFVQLMIAKRKTASLQGYSYSLMEA